MYSHLYTQKALCIVNQSNAWLGGGIWRKTSFLDLLRSYKHPAARQTSREEAHPEHQGKKSIKKQRNAELAEHKAHELRNQKQQTASIRRPNTFIVVQRNSPASGYYIL